MWPHCLSKAGHQLLEVVRTLTVPATWLLVTAEMRGPFGLVTKLCGSSLLGKTLEDYNGLGKPLHCAPQRSFEPSCLRVQQCLKASYLAAGQMRAMPLKTRLRLDPWGGHRETGESNPSYTTCPLCWQSLSSSRQLLRRWVAQRD